jgi:alpha-glucoside transport system permease protein
VGGVFFLYWAMNRIVELLPERYREGVRPYVFVGPALVILGVFLVYPVINTLLISLKDSTGQLRRAGQLQVRLHRREHAARDPQHAGWTLVVPAVAVSIGSCSPPGPIACGAARRSPSR